MSEELLQINEQKIGKYSYYKIGATTLNQLKQNGLISKDNYGELSAKKPDGLINLNNKTIAIVEYKTPKELSSDKQIKKAIEQEIKVARKLCKILIVTDGSKTFWINALNGEFILNEHDDNLNTVFDIKNIITNIDEIEFILEHIDGSISNTNSKLQGHKLLDLSPLAKSMWQTIWAATGKSPVKCLYNVVELFIFKFLSDLDVLGKRYNFNVVYEISRESEEEALKYYATLVRQQIVELFPKGDDGTTIINGTIFVDEKGNANLSQSILFSRSLSHLKNYGEKFGSLVKIDKQFKTKLYETFLNQEVEAMGQYFTPRKIVQTIIRMSGLDSETQYKNKKIGDPFCGVGGFPLEILNLNENMKNEFKPKRKKITPNFELVGYDKGFEKDDERTIILAKANMLIYLAELLFKNPTCTKEFAAQFNKTFTLFKNNLGTFGHIIKDEDDKFDYILTNPPFVTSGTGIIQEEIKNNPVTSNEYTTGGMGLESLGVEWIIKSLKGGGKSFIILPDGIFYRQNAQKLRTYILEHCFLDGIVSLPARTFFSNNRKTYILCVTKKQNIETVQKHKVFTYIVSEIGEELTKIGRAPIEKNNLPELEKLFSIFRSSKELIDIYPILEKQSPRCKLFDLEMFRNSKDWMFNEWFDEKVLIELGEKNKSLDIEISDFSTLVDSVSTENIFTPKDFANIKISWGESTYMKISKLFDLTKTTNDSSFTKSFVRQHKGNIPVYGASKFAEQVGYGYVQDNLTGVKYFENSLTWNIDGSYKVHYRKGRFSLSEKVIPLVLKDEYKDVFELDFLKYVLNEKISQNNYHFNKKGGKSRLGDIELRIPLIDGKICKEKQCEIITIYKTIEAYKEEIKKERDILMSQIDGLINSNVTLNF